MSQLHHYLPPQSDILTIRLENPIATLSGGSYTPFDNNEGEEQEEW